MQSVLRTPDEALQTRLTWFWLLVPVITWVSACVVVFDWPKGEAPRVLWFALKQTPNIYWLWIPPLIAWIASLPIFVWFYRYEKTNLRCGDFVKHLSGVRMVSEQKLKSRTTEKGYDQLDFARVPLPRENENLHCLVAGSTGGGKSVVINEHMASIMRRFDLVTKKRQVAEAKGVSAPADQLDKIICVDPDGGFMSNFYREGDVILNPFDGRGLGWSIFNEIQTVADCMQYGKTLIPQGVEAETERWNSMARLVTSWTIHELKVKGMGRNDCLLYWLTMAGDDALKELLKDTPAAACFGSPETFGSIKTVLTDYVAPHILLEEGDFSIKAWLTSGTGNLWITWKADTLQSMKPLISCWVDTVIVSALAMSPNKERRTHLILDEMDSLTKLNYLMDGVTKGRAKGLRILGGIQSRAQLNDTYGKEIAMTLCNSFRNFAAVGVAGLDTYTNEEFSKALGKHVVVRKYLSKAQGGGWNKTFQQDAAFVVEPHEFSTLPSRVGYLRLALDYPIMQFRSPIVNYPMAIEAFKPSNLYEPIGSGRERKNSALELAHSIRMQAEDQAEKLKQNEELNKELTEKNAKAKQAKVKGNKKTKPQAIGDIKGVVDEDTGEISQLEEFDRMRAGNA